MIRSYTWEYRIDVPPYDKLMEVLEAFFASYPGGDYTCERRERYRLHFRRGLWRKSWLGLGDLVPDRLVKGQFNRWPVIVLVLSSPSPSATRCICPSRSTRCRRRCSPRSICTPARNSTNCALIWPSAPAGRRHRR
jgi:hypothetical protein